MLFIALGDEEIDRSHSGYTHTIRLIRRTAPSGSGIHGGPDDAQEPAGIRERCQE